MKYADLHVHTFYSDSTFSPEEVMACAREKGLAAIAICDHDSTGGIEPCRQLGLECGIEVVPGIEMTVEKTDAEIHILGYFIDWKDEQFQKRLKLMQGHRIDRMHKMVEKLNAAGVSVDAEDVFRTSGKGTVGRLHLARVLLRTKAVKTLKEAFDKYIGFLKPCYVPNIKFSPREAIETILGVGGVPILAHPDFMRKDEYIIELIEHGLRGIEVYHSDHSTKASAHYEGLAKRYGLLMTGGSDCHGLGKGRVLIGTVRVPYALVDKLKKESERIRDAKR